jgi:hypothetical protein
MCCGLTLGIGVVLTLALWCVDIHSSEEKKVLTWVQKKNTSVT